MNRFWWWRRLSYMMRRWVVSLMVSMVHCAVYSFTMASLDHLVTDLQGKVARQQTDTNNQDMLKNKENGN